MKNDLGNCTRYFNMDWCVDGFNYGIFRDLDRHHRTEGKMKSNEFAEFLRDIGNGADVDQGEIADALCYAGNAWYEIQQLTKGLAAGYYKLQKDIERKNRIIESVNRTLTAARAENQRLRENLAAQMRDNRGMDGDVDA